MTRPCGFGSTAPAVRRRGSVTTGAGTGRDEAGRVDGLRGYVAPKGCSAVGAVAAGWAVPMAGAGSRERVRTTVLVGRDGDTAARLRWTSGQVVDAPPGSGRLLDCLRRAFVLAT